MERGLGPVRGRFVLPMMVLDKTGALPSLGLTSTGELVAAHRDETAQVLRLTRWDGVRWTTTVPGSPIFQPGLRPALVGVDDGRVRIFHGTGLGSPDESDGSLLETEGAVAGPYSTGALPDFSTGGYTGAAHGERGTFVATRRYSRSALFGSSDALLLYSGAPLESRVLEQYGGGDVRHTFKFIRVAVDPSVFRSSPT